MSEVKNILLAGVGGQGILLASEVISEVMLLAGLDVKKNEIHGMSQRGGSVVSHVRYGDKVDILFSFELLETCRYLPLLRKNGRVVINNMQISPPGVARGVQEYPDAIANSIKKQFPQSVVVDGLDLALSAGNPKTVNTVLLGTLSKLLDYDRDLWITALERMIPSRLLDVNMKAFELGCGEA